MACIFCEILKGSEEASFVYKDEFVSAFMDIQPVNRGHLLVVPNRHAPFLADLDAETGARLFQVAQRMAAAIRSSDLRCEGINLFLADGEAAMQEVFHVHLHVFPRVVGDGFGLVFGEDYFMLPDRTELEMAAASIRSQLRGEQ